MYEIRVTGEAGIIEREFTTDIEEAIGIEIEMTAQWQGVEIMVYKDGKAVSEWPPKSHRAKEKAMRPRKAMEE